MRLVVESLPVRPGHSRDAPVTWTSSRRFVLVAATRVEFFNSTGWAFYVQVAVPMRLPDAGRLVVPDLFGIRSGLIGD